MPAEAFPTSRVSDYYLLGQLISTDSVVANSRLPHNTASLSITINKIPPRLQTTFMALLLCQIQLKLSNGLKYGTLAVRRSDYLDRCAYSCIVSYDSLISELSFKRPFKKSKQILL